MSLTEEKVLTDLRALNANFHAGSIEPLGIIAALRQLGVEPLRSVLIELFPDSGDTWVGELVDEDLNAVRFDIDLEDAANSRLHPLGAERFRKRQGQILWTAVQTIMGEIRGSP